MLRAYFVVFALTCGTLQALAGPFPPAAGQLGSDAILHTSPLIKAWATGVEELVRGPMNIANPGLGLASAGSAADALETAQGNTSGIVSLGDGGYITLTFDKAIRNGAGPDFAVFENSFGDTFLELAFVEVSSNGVDFIRFPAISLTPFDIQVDPFGSLDPTNLHNLAGKYRAGFGTPFDLEELIGISPLLDVNAVTHVRIIDVVGSIDPLYASYDSLGNRVNDPWPTPFASSGFDLDAVAVLNVVPEPAAWLMATLAACAIGPMMWRRRKERLPIA